MERLRNGERLLATYVWTDDGEAVLAPERGIASAAEVQPGVRHMIPSTSDCRACHEGNACRGWPGALIGWSIHESLTLL